MKKKYLFILWFTFVCIFNSYSQNNDENVIITDPHTAYFSYKLTKASFDMRGMNGMTVITPEFEGDRWEEDAKSAVTYACKLMEEYLPTAYPIVIKMNRDAANSYVTFVRSATTLVFDYTGTSYPSRHKIAQPRATIKRTAIDGFVSETIYWNPFEEPDATIYFSPDDIFSTRLDGDVDPDKYDLVTITLRELAKVLAMNTSVTTIKGTNNQLSIFLDNEGEHYVTPYTNALTIRDNYGDETLQDPSEAYNYFTSDNVTIKYPFDYQYYNGHKIYSPSQFNRNSSLLYFEEDSTNKETLLFQPNLPKGTAIHYIGTAFRDVLRHSNWDYLNIPTSTGTPIGKTEIDKNVYDGTSNNVFSYNGINPNGSNTLNADTENVEVIIKNPIIQSNTDNNIPFRIASNFTDLYSMFPKSQCDGVLLRGSYEHQPVNIDGDLGISVYLLKKDGTLQRIANYSYAWIPLTVNFADYVNDTHARTSDGYLRVRFNLNFNEISPTWENGEMWYNTVRFLAMDAVPETPILGVKRNYLRSAPDNPDDYYKEINLVFGNMEGIINARMIQKEYDNYGLVSSVSYPVEIHSGNFITEVDKELRTTFQLVANNGKGEKLSDIVTIYPQYTDANGNFDLILSVNDEIATWKFLDVNGLPVDVKVEQVRIYNLTNPNINFSTMQVNENKVNLQGFQKGVYSITVQDKNNNLYTQKFIK